MSRFSVVDDLAPFGPLHEVRETDRPNRRQVYTPQPTPGGQACTFVDEDGKTIRGMIDAREGNLVRVRYGTELRWVEEDQVKGALLPGPVGLQPEETASIEPSDEDLCYRVGKWPRMLWNEYREACSSKVEAVARRGNERAPRFPDFMRELFSRLLNPHTPRLEQPADGAKWAETAHAQADELPAWQQLAAAVDGDETSAGFGAVAVAETLAAEMRPRKSKADLEEIQQRLESLQSMADAGVDVDRRLKLAERDLDAAQKEAEALASGMDPTAIRNALRTACEKAQAGIEESNQTMRAFTFGTQPGVPVRLSIDERRKLSSLLKQNTKLAQIAKRLGRLRRIADAKQRTKVNRAREEVHDIEQGADLDRLLPNEAAALASGDEVLSAHAFGKYTERRLLQYALRGKEKTGRGPIVICCDESGSTQGNPEVWQKAVCLALLDVAIRQKRALAIVHFDTRVHRTDIWENGSGKFIYTDHRSSGGVKTQAKNATEFAIEACTHFTGGGTNFEQPLSEARALVESSEFNKADVLLITDGNAALSDNFVLRFNEVKARKDFRLLVTTVGYVGNLDQVRAIADQVFTYNDIMNDDGSFNDAAFSI
jgi:uncharacterized protein with von Willebrand factor type A (vWA) domain